jgi:MFS family permease
VGLFDFGKTFGLMKDRIVMVVTTSQLMRVMGRSMVWVFAPIYFHRFYGTSFFTIGLLFFLGTIISFPFSIYGGNLIDRAGRRFVGLLLPPISAALFLVFSLSAFLRFPGIYAFIAFLVIFPLADLEGIVDQVIITDVVKESERLDAFSLNRIGANVGFAIGPAVAGILAEFNYGWAFIVPFFVSVFVFVIYARYIRETRPAGTGTQSRSRGFSFPKNDRKFFIIVILLSMIWFIAGQWGTTLTLFLSSGYLISDQTIGFLYAFNGIVVIFFQIPVNNLLHKWHDFKRLALGAFIYSFAFFFYSLTSYIPLLFANTFFLTIGENVLTPSTQTVIAKAAPEDRRGEYFGSYYAVSGLIVPLAPLLGTYGLGFLIHSGIIFWGIIGLSGILIGSISYLTLRSLYGNE